MTGYGEGVTREGTVGLDESRPLLVVGLVLFFAYFLTVLYVQHWHTAVDSQNYAAEGRPLLRNLDGYYYLRHARDIGKEPILATTPFAGPCARIRHHSCLA